MTTTLTIVYPSEGGYTDGDGPMNAERGVKVKQMLAEGKTTQVYGDVNVLESTVTRTFVDQAAAEEYLAFATALAAKYGKTIVSSSIS